MCQQPVSLPDACVQCVVNGIPYTIGQTIEDRRDECTTWREEILNFN